VRGQAPRGVRLEHVVLEHELPRVGPVVGNFALAVVAHHVERKMGDAVVWIDRIDAGLACADEAVHASVVKIGAVRALVV
jgi:hypothetical protein